MYCNIDSNPTSKPLSCLLLRTRKPISPSTESMEHVTFVKFEKEVDINSKPISNLLVYNKHKPQLFGRYVKPSTTHFVKCNDTPDDMIKRKCGYKYKTNYSHL